jgi:NADH:ubiquinone oxidoreductase subunit 6 (subunit J)
MGNFLVWLVWILAAATCIGSGIAVITLANPFYSALSLIGNLASLAVLYLLASAEFVAAAQVLVYAGAVLVMFLFVIAYLGGRADAPWAGGTRLFQAAAATAAAALLVVVLVAIGTAVADQLSEPEDISRAFGSPAAIGELFLTDHLLAFEITSIILLVGAVGGVVLGMGTRDAAEPGEEGHSGQPGTAAGGDRAARTSEQHRGTVPSVDSPQGNA